MTKDELQKLKESLLQRIAEIDKELSPVSLENPAIKGDFNVQTEDIGSSEDDTAQEAGELDRNQALVDSLERERKEIENALAKIAAGTYGN